MVSDVEEADLKSTPEEELVRNPKNRKVRKLESDEEIKDESHAY